MSRSFRRTVELPAERVKADRAPYLHETTHVLVPVRSRSMWLSEGFASFVQSYVAEHKGGYDGYVFSWGGNANVDSLARRYLARESGKSVLPFVGGAGSPPEVWEERRQVAAPFYVLSHSFVKYLVLNAGLAVVKEIVRADDVPAALERATSRSLAHWKAEWLASLEAVEASREGNHSPTASSSATGVDPWDENHAIPSSTRSKSTRYRPGCSGAWNSQGISTSVPGATL